MRTVILWVPLVGPPVFFVAGYYVLGTISTAVILLWAFVRWGAKEYVRQIARMEIASMAEELPPLTSAEFLVDKLPKAFFARSLFASLGMDGSTADHGFWREEVRTLPQYAALRRSFSGNSGENRSSPEVEALLREFPDEYLLTEWHAMKLPDRAAATEVVTWAVAAVLSIVATVLWVRG